TRTRGTDDNGIRRDPSPRNNGASRVPIENIIAKRLRKADVNDIVATYRYFATRTFTRGVAEDITVSHVEFSRSPAVESIAGCRPPTVSMMMKNIGSTTTKAPTSRPLDMFLSATAKFSYCSCVMP